MKMSPYISSSDVESIDEITRLANTEQLLRFVVLLGEWFSPTEVVLVLRSLKASHNAPVKSVVSKVESKPAKKARRKKP